MDDFLNTPKEQKVLQCLYCGNKTLMNMVGQYKYSWDEDYGYYGYFLYRMYSCPVCEKVTFHQSYWDCTQSDHEGNDFIDEEILYPINSLETNFCPAEVKNAFESALKAKNIDNNVCLMALRRTLELILKNNGATKWGLKDKIEELAKINVLPNTLKEASLIAKAFGDTAAHSAGQNMTTHDIDKLIGFIEYLLEYFYILPGKINEFNLKLEKLKEDDAHENG